METKKSKHADLEPKKSIFLEIGLIAALGLLLAAFEWKTPVKHLLVVTEKWEAIGEDVVIRNTTFEEKKPAPKPVVAPLFKIVENDELVKDNIVIDADIKPTDEAPIYTPPVSVTLEEEKSVIEEAPFIVVENMPEFPGGMNALQKFLADNIEFPQLASETNIQGTVYLYFVVEKDGSISNIKTLRRIGGGCDEEAERVISKMPKWKPGNQRGKPVRVSYNMPVIFKLQ